jgi:hypothetical protein
MTAKPLSSRLTSGSRMTGSHTARHNQRCAVRLMYTKNQIRGQWAAHGRYLMRDSATALRPDGAASFGSARERAQIPEVLAGWQKSGDERLFKLIISPEFGERLDLERLTWDIMTAVESDVGRPLQWAAVVHRNTEHPHVHSSFVGWRTASRSVSPESTFSTAFDATPKAHAHCNSGIAPASTWRKPNGVKCRRHASPHSTAF